VRLGLTVPNLSVVIVKTAYQVRLNLMQYVICCMSCLERCSFVVKCGRTSECLSSGGMPEVEIPKDTPPG
jgi:hypothetical protein